MTEVKRGTRFAVGEVVRHRRYPYRGVIAGYDEAFMGTDEWYCGNSTQPDRSRPWYHVLIHGTSRSAYVAEENLLTDTCGEQVVHPLVKRCFVGFCKGHYVEA